MRDHNNIVLRSVSKPLPSAFGSSEKGSTRERCVGLPYLVSLPCTDIFWNAGSTSDGPSAYFHLPALFYEAEVRYGVLELFLESFDVAASVARQVARLLQSG